MRIDCASEFNGLGNIVDRLLAKDAGLSRALRGCELSIGLANDDAYGVTAAAYDPIFVGDSAWIEGRNITPVTEALLQSDPSKVVMKPRFNHQTQKWAYDFLSALAGDSVDAFLTGQAFNPSNIAYLSKVWKEPLAYSAIDKMVSFEQGSNPFAELFTLALEVYSGWGMLGETGSLQNTMTSDVNVRDGMMTAPVINVSGTYSLTLEESVRGSVALGPIPNNRSPMAKKQSYLNYVMNMIKATIGYFGNAETGTLGLLDVNPIELWDSSRSLKSIKEGTSPNKGSLVYQQLADIINEMLVSSMNKFDTIKIALSPYAYNLLRSMPYSDNYDPTSAMKIFWESYDVKNKDNRLNVEFVSEPLLSANTIFNPSDADLMVITAPTVGGGPDDEKQSTVVFGAPLQKFVFPVIQGQYNGQYKTLARYAGILAPVPAGVKVIRGFGVQ